ncbi:MAG: AAA family ATPase [Candidatus Woesearchaeota archaeon]
MGYKMKYANAGGLPKCNPIARENELLKATVASLQAELMKYRSPPQLVCEVRKLIGEKAIVRLSNNHSFLVDMSDHLKGKLNPGDYVLAEQKTLVINDKIMKPKEHGAENFVIIQKPKESYKDIGGLKEEIGHLKEVVELPLKNPMLFKEIGIEPPKGILLHGPPGCGKTLLVKAIANATDTTFIEIVASELVQKYIGEGAKLVKEVFQLAKEKAPSIVFIDEIDALAAERVDIGISGEREVQRTFMQLLAEIDGFEPLGDVKVIGATNRIDIIDSALLRPGRFERLIEVGMPDAEERKEILKIYMSRMKTGKVKVSELIGFTDSFSGADLKAVCTEAGYSAIRQKRSKVMHNDFLSAIAKIKANDSLDTEYMKMFG